MSAVEIITSKVLREFLGKLGPEAMASVSKMAPDALKALENMPSNSGWPDWLKN